MKKKMLFITLAFLIILPCMFLIAGCDASFFDKSIWKVEREATCTEKGLKSRIVDGVREEKEIPALGHSYDAWTRVKEPTCTEEGVKERTCERCHYVDEGVINPYHVYDTANILDYDEDNHWFRCTRCTGKTRLFEHKFEYTTVPIIIYDYHFCEVIGYENITSCEDCGIKIRDTHMITEKTQEQYSEDSVRPYELFDAINRFDGDAAFELNYNLKSDKKLTSYTVKNVSSSSTSKMLRMDAVIDGQSCTIYNYYTNDWELTMVSSTYQGQEEICSTSVEYSRDHGFSSAKIYSPLGETFFKGTLDQLYYYSFTDINDTESGVQDTRYRYHEFVRYNYKNQRVFSNYEYLGESQTHIVSADFCKYNNGNLVKIYHYDATYDKGKITKLVKIDAEGNLKSQIDVSYNDDGGVETLKYIYYDGATLVTDKTWNFIYTDDSFKTTDGSYNIKFKDTHSNNNTNLK